MSVALKILDCIAEAYKRKSRIKLLLKDQNQLYEGMIDKIYENHAIRFVTSTSGRNPTITGFVLVSDIHQIFY